MLISDLWGFNSQDDITRLEVDGIVNAANKSLPGQHFVDFASPDRL